MLNVMANHHDSDNNPFEDYLWMGEMEKFDEEVEAEFEEAFKEEEFIKSCIEQLLEEEEERETVFFQQMQNGQNGDYNPHHNNCNSNYSNGNQQVPYTNGLESVTQDMGSLYVTHNNANHSMKENGLTRPAVSTGKNQSAPFKSMLNPNAAPFFMNPNAKEFVPRFTTVPSNSTNGTASHTMPSHKRSGK